MFCIHCGQSSTANFCDTCRKTAKEAIDAQADKIACYHCRVSYKRKTVVATGGFCGRCINKQPAEESDKSTHINMNLRRLVWIRYNGLETGVALCFCCAETCNVWDFECGHVEAESKGGPTSVENLRPICRSCNRGMSTINMRVYASDHRMKGRIAVLKGAADGTVDYVMVEDDLSEASNRWTCKSDACLVM